jgi:hypothetical protein
VNLTPLAAQQARMGSRPLNPLQSGGNARLRLSFAVIRPREHCVCRRIVWIQLQSRLEVVYRQIVKATIPINEPEGRFLFVTIRPEIVCKVAQSVRGNLWALCSS